MVVLREMFMFSYGYRSTGRLQKIDGEDVEDDGQDHAGDDGAPERVKRIFHGVVLGDLKGWKIPDCFNGAEG